MQTFLCLHRLVCLVTVPVEITAGLLMGKYSTVQELFSVGFSHWRLPYALTKRALLRASYHLQEGQYVQTKKKKTRPPKTKTANITTECSS